MTGHTSWNEIKHEGVLWQLVHVEHGPITAFDTQTAAERQLATVLEDEPDWNGLLRVQEFRVAS